MRILYVAMRHDYGRPEQGSGYEHENFYGTLVQEGHKVDYFDFMQILHAEGRDALNRRLRETAGQTRPDLVFCSIFEEEFDFDTIRSITDSGIVTFNWFADDHWRFERFSKRWAPAFTWVGTTDSAAVAKYEAAGFKGALKTQWACNHFRYRKLDLPLKHDVSFVGMAHGDRPKLIGFLREQGIDVVTYGSGWPEGRIDQDGMIALFNQSRINLNLSNSSIRPSFWKRLLYLFRGGGRTRQIKGRNFEVPGCGGFLLTGVADNLEAYYKLGSEVAIYEDRKDLLAKIRYYLSHESERSAVALAGYRRTLDEHTYSRRFATLFRQMGLT